MKASDIREIVLRLGDVAEADLHDLREPELRHLTWVARQVRHFKFLKIVGRRINHLQHLAGRRKKRRERGRQMKRHYAADRRISVDEEWNPPNYDAAKGWSAVAEEGHSIRALQGGAPGLIQQK